MESTINFQTIVFIYTHALRQKYILFFSNLAFHSNSNTKSVNQYKCIPWPRGPCIEKVQLLHFGDESVIVILPWKVKGKKYLSFVRLSFNKNLNLTAVIYFLQKGNKNGSSFNINQYPLLSIIKAQSKPCSNFFIFRWRILKMVYFSSNRIKPSANNSLN